VSWFELSLASMTLYGIQAFLFRVAAQKKCDSSLLLFFFMLSAGSLALLMYLLNPSRILNFRYLFFYAILQVIFYLFRQIAKIEAMKYIPGIVALPITATQGLITVILGICLLQEKITVVQSLGIILAFIVILILSREKEKERKLRNIKLGVMLAISAAILGGIVNFIIKLAAPIINPFLFISISYYFALLPSYLFYRLEMLSTKTKRIESIKLGIYSGVVNFLAFSLFLLALAQGPVSIIVPLVDLNLLLAVILIVVIYKEKPTLPRILGVFGAIIATILLRG